MQYRAGAIEFLLHEVRFEAKPVAGALHDCPTRGGLAAHKQGNADDALITDNRNFGRGAILHDVEERDDRRRWKIYVGKRGT